MYDPRRPKTRRPLKKRAAVFVSKPFPSETFWQINGWTSLVVMGTTIVPPRVVPRIFTYIKKLIRYPQTRSRFWVNAQCAFLVTRKPLNVRMGKGKGAKVRHYSLIGGSTSLASVSELRPGLKRKLKRFMGIRLGRKVFVLDPKRPTSKVEWSQAYRTQKDFLKARAGEVKTLLTFIRRPSIKLFFGRLFKAGFRKPRLRWRFRWPSLPKISMRLRGRRKKWGSGVRKFTMVWAGLSSLMLGVRRPKKKSTRRKGVLKKLKKEVGFTFHRIKGLSKKPRSLVLLKKLLRTKSKFFYEILRKMPLRSPKGSFSKSKALIPFRRSVYSLAKFWNKFGLRLSPAELSSFPPKKEASLAALVRTIAVFEKKSLLMEGGSRPSSKKGKLLVEGTLDLLRSKDTKDRAEPILAAGGSGSVVIGYLVRDGVIGLWPRRELRPLALTYVVFNPTKGGYKCILMDPKLPSRSHKQQSYLLTKHSLFSVYLATLSKSSYPSFKSNNRLSSLHGLTSKKGKKSMNPQRWVWLVGPVWSAWTAWFDALSSAFQLRGVCYVYGSPAESLISKSFTWLTLGGAYYDSNLSRHPLSRVNLNRSFPANFPAKAFWLITATQRSFKSNGLPTFSLSGSNVRNRVGWSVLPGPSGNKALSKLIMIAALAAYRTSKA